MAQRLLKDVDIRNAKGTGKPYRLADGGSLWLRVGPTGARSWQVRYWHAGKQQTATLGKYPAMSLAAARKAAAGTMENVADGTHYTAAKRVAKAQKIAAAAQTFAMVRDDWIDGEARRAAWTPKYAGQVRALFSNHLSALDRLPVASITAPATVPILRAVAKKAPHMAEKAERALHAVMDHAVRLGQIERNPLPPRRPASIERRHYPAVTDVAEIGAILRNARASDPCKAIVRAHELLAFTAQRVAEVTGATWQEFDLKHGTWSIPRSRMKKKDAGRGPHLVPIPPTMLARLREWHAADAAEPAGFVCPAPRDPSRSITPEAIEKWMRDVLHLGGIHSPHSWRSAFKTITSDAGKDGDAIEAQLDHQIGSKVANAYDRAKRLELRRPLLAWYESTLLAARDGAAVVQIKRGA